MPFLRDKVFADQFTDEIRGYVSYYITKPGLIIDDVERCTDLIIRGTTRVGMRVRRPPTQQRYYDQFTIRWKLDSGHRTEIHKLEAGWGDYYFYSFCDPQETRIIKWTIFDLNIFRARLRELRSMLSPGQEPGEEIYNGDGTWGRALYWSQFPASMIVASSKPPRNDQEWIWQSQ